MGHEIGSQYRLRRVERGHWFEAAADFWRSDLQTVWRLGFWLVAGQLVLVPHEMLATSQASLQLTEQKTLSLPWRPAGAAVLEGVLFVWSAESPVAYILDGDRLDSIASPFLRRPLGVRPVHNGRAIEILANGGASSVTVSRSGCVLREVPTTGLEPLLQFQSVHGTSSGWAVLGQDSFGIGRLFLVLPSGRAREVMRNEFQGKPPGRGLAVVDGRLLVLGWPSAFEAVWETYEAGSPPLQLIPEAVLREVGNPEHDDGLWIPLGVVPLDVGFVITFADMRSDRRIVAVYGPHLAFLRASLMRGQFAFVAGDPPRRQLWAVRVLESAEITMYEWSWVP